MKSSTEFATLFWHNLFPHSTHPKVQLQQRRVLKKLFVDQVVKRFSSCYVARKFATVFTGAWHWTFSEPDESNPQSHILFVQELYLNAILSSNPKPSSLQCLTTACTDEGFW